MPPFFFLAIFPKLERHVQLGGKVPEQYAFYEGICGYFALKSMQLKVIPRPWNSGSTQIYIRAFQKSIISQFWSRGFKVASLQS